MNFIIKEEFSKKLNILFKKYKNILKDFDNFQETFNLSQQKHLWQWIYKCRMKNTSIPTGKRGWFRIIILVRILENKALPFIIYSKRDMNNISLQEIKDIY